MAIFLAAWAITLLTSVGEHDSFALPVIVAASVLAGALACDWRVLLLAVAVIPLAAFESCDEQASRCEINAPVYAAVVFAPLAAVLLAIGVRLGKALGRTR